MPFTLTHTGQSICISMAPDDIALSAAPMKLRCQSGQDVAEIEISSEQFKLLALQCIALMPDLEPRIAVPNQEEACRIPAYALKQLADREIQSLIRECQCDTLECFLWYMKDGDLLRLILRNMSQRAAEMLMTDMEQCWLGHDPDKATESKAREGRAAVHEIITLARRMHGEGLITELPEYGPAPARLSAESPTHLATNEWDELLKDVTQEGNQ